DDGNVCTNDSCDSALGCRHANNTSPCSDNNACTTNDTCAGGTCIGGPPPNCDDGNVCTNDTCDSALSCRHANNTRPCSANNACRHIDSSAGRPCTAGPSPDLDDGNVCTNDTCDSALGCRHANNASPCSDNNACTTNDTCAGGTCIGGPPPNCDDGNVCTNDT